MTDFDRLIDDLLFKASDDHRLMRLAGFAALPEDVRATRQALLRARIIVTAGVLALSTILWSVFDALAFTSDLWMKLLVQRSVAGLCLLGIILIAARSHRLGGTFLALFLLMMVPTAFFHFCRLPDVIGIYSSFGRVVMTSYSLLPLIVFSGLALFPLTFLESSLLQAPFVAIYLIGALYHPLGHSLTFGLGNIWIMLLLGFISALAGASQLSLLIPKKPR